MQEQGGLMVEICIKTEMTVVSCFYETLWTVLCNSSQLYIGSNSQIAKLWGHIFHGFCNPKITAMPLFSGPLKSAVFAPGLEPPYRSSNLNPRGQAL